MSPKPETEHAQLMSGGGYHIRNSDPEIERIYPLAQWIKSRIPCPRGGIPGRALGPD